MFLWNLFPNFLRQQAENSSAADGSAQDQETVAGLLDFDFDLSTPEGEGDDTQNASGGQDTVSSGQGDDTVEAGAAGASGEEPTLEAGKEEDPRDKLLQDQQKLIEKLLSEKQPPAKKDDTPSEPEYVQEYKKLAIPADIQAKLDSEDPEERRGTLSGLIQSVLIRAQADARKYFEGELQRLRSEVPTMATETVNQQAQAMEIERDFFGNYPQLGKPMLKQIAISEMLRYGQELAGQGKQVNYTPAFRDEVAKRVVEGLGGTFIKAGTKAPAPTTKKRQPFVAGTGSRPGGTGQQTEANEIADTIGLT